MTKTFVKALRVERVKDGEDVIGHRAIMFEIDDSGPCSVLDVAEGKGMDPKQVASILLDVHNDCDAVYIGSYQGYLEPTQEKVGHFIIDRPDAITVAEAAELLMDVHPLVPETFKRNRRNEPVWHKPMSVKITRMDNSIGMTTPAGSVRLDGEVIAEVGAAMGGFAFVVHIKGGSSFVIDVKSVIEEVVQMRDELQQPENLPLLRDPVDA